MLNGIGLKLMLAILLNEEVDLLAKKAANLN